MKGVSVRVISSNDPEKLEDRIDAFVEDDMEIHSIQFQAFCDEESNYYTAMIIWSYPPDDLEDA